MFNLFVLLALGVYMVIYGWRTYYKHQKMLIWPIEPLALWIFRMVSGEEAAKKRESELLQPKRLHLMGNLALGGGVLALGIVLILIGFGIWAMFHPY